MLGISLGAAPTLSAAGEPGLVPSLSAVLTLGGYASSRELLRYTLTGAYAFGNVRGRRPVDEEGASHASPAPMPTSSSEAAAHWSTIVIPIRSIISSTICLKTPADCSMRSSS